MKIYQYRYTLMRKHKKTNNVLEGISGNDYSKLSIMLSSAQYEYPEYEHWIRENKSTKIGDIFIGA